MIISEDLKKIFGSKYYNHVCNYIEMVQNVINTHQIVVFMARKAYCLYLALKKNNLIEVREECTILSSRAITYNGIDFSNKNVAIVEDVVILGESLREITENIIFKDCTIDIYILSCSKQFFHKQNSNNYANSKYYCTLNMEENDLLELATLITNYIIYEMVPYNSDYPAYSFSFSNIDELNICLSKHNLYMITDLVHCKNEFIKEGVIPVEGYLFNSFLTPDIINDSIFKIRVYIDSKENTCYFIPIVILSKLTKEELEDIFYNLFYKQNYFVKFVSHDDATEELKNKLRLISYKLSEDMLRCLFNEIFTNFDVKKISSEEELFTLNLQDKLALCTNVIEKQKDYNIEFETSSFFNSLGFAYDLLIDNFLFDEVRFKNDYIRFEDIKEKVRCVETDAKKIKLLSSLVLDVFIDNGVVVPRTKIDNNIIERTFKFGEVAKLTLKDFVLFAMMLNEYSDLIGRTLDKTEMEKISVLFFRQFNNSFDVSNNESESYRICYSKFGPRISSSNTAYRVSQGQALTDVLVERNFVQKVGDKFDILPVSQDEEFNKVKKFQRAIFASKLKKLNECFTSAYEKNKDQEVFKYINSYIRLLTLLSIGNNENDKILSLIAEVDLIKTRSLLKYDNIDMIVRVLTGVIDGVLSGLWKYFCYKNNNPLNKLFKIICSDIVEDNIILALDTFMAVAAEDNTMSENNFLDLIGIFLCKVCVFYEFLCKHAGVKIYEDYTKAPYRNLLNNCVPKEIYEEYKLKFRDETGTNIQGCLKEIDDMSCRLLDMYQVYQSCHELKYEEYRECIVFFNHDSGKVLSNLDCSKLRILKHNDLIIVPFFDYNKKNILDVACNLLEDADTKILYYSTIDDNTLLLSPPFNFAGKKFLEELSNVVNYVRRNMTSQICNEIFILPKKDFEDLSFKTYDFAFEYVDKTKYENEKNIYRYNFKKIYKSQTKIEEDTKIEMKLEIGEIHVSGDMIINNIEKINGDLTQLYNTCKDEKVKKYIKEAKEAAESKDEPKLKKALKWLGIHALEFVKKAATSTLFEAVKSSMSI